MQEEAQILESQMEELRRKQTNAEEQHKKDIETVVIKLQQEVLNGHIEKYQSEIQSHEQQIEELTRNAEKLTKSHNDKVDLLEQEKTKLSSCINSFANKLAESEKRLKQVITESDARVDVMIREAKTAIEEEMRLTAERYKKYLAQIEKERSELDKKLVRNDVEINRLLAILEELKFSVETQMELDRAKIELTEKKEGLIFLKDQIRTEAAEMEIRKKRLEVIIAENKASVDTLTKHLTQGNADEESLKYELELGEDCINEYRDLLTGMRNISKEIHVQTHVLMKQFDASKQLVILLESERINVIELIRSVFESKIEDVKRLTTKEVTQFQADCEAKDAQNAEMKNQLRKMADRLSEMQNMLHTLEKKSDAQELEISRMELIHRKLNERLKESETAMVETNKFLEAEVVKHQAALNEASTRIEELSNTIEVLEEKGVGAIEDKTDLLEEERARREAAEEEVRKLREYNAHLKKDHEEMSEKYAELIGHQNHRQRIKHVSQLKDKINQLEEAVVVEAPVVVEVTVDMTMEAVMDAIVTNATNLDTMHVTAKRFRMFATVVTVVDTSQKIANR
ncbi:hypothetical protein WN55_05941 [Dufourea novaeangliae]|nr:hypothetical protein WN55_05941 [Dufourea novaeangliae]